MANSIEQNTPDVLAEVLGGAKHIDALEVLQEDILFLTNMQDRFASSRHAKPTKEENAVMAKYQTILDNKTEYLGQLLEAADMNFSKHRSTFNDFKHMLELYNITVVISPKEKE